MEWLGVAGEETGGELYLSVLEVCFAASMVLVWVKIFQDLEYLCCIYSLYSTAVTRAHSQRHKKKGRKRGSSVRQS